MADIIRNNITFTGSKAGSAAEYYDTVLTAGYKGDHNYLAWDAAHKFGAGCAALIGDSCSFCFGFFAGARAQAAAAAFNAQWDALFAATPAPGRRKALQPLTNKLLSDIVRQYAVKVEILDRYYF